MEVQASQIIDLSLTTAQLLVAGVLSVVVYSLLFGRKGPKAAVPQAMPPTVSSSTVSTVAPRDIIEGPRSIQFVSLAPKEEQLLGGIRDSLIEGRRRNRAEVIRQARQMMETGAGNREISTRLRLTEGELALLRKDMNR